MAVCALVMPPSEEWEIGGMMYEDRTESEAGSQTELMSRAGVVRRVVTAMDHMGRDEFNVLLSDLLCAAWPTPTAQSQ
jgi:hypothetical protein